MNDLFRFLMMRAAKPAADTETDKLAFSNEAKRLSHGEVHLSLARIGAAVRNSERFVASVQALRLGERVLAVMGKLGPPPVSGAKVRETVEAVLGKSASETVVSDEFKDDLARLGDSLLAMKITSSGHGADAAELIAARRAYTLIERSANTDDALHWLPMLYDAVAPPSQAASPMTEASVEADEDTGALEKLDIQLRQIDDALSHLAEMRPADLLPIVPPPNQGPPKHDEISVLPESGGASAAHSLGGFRLNTNAIGRMPVGVSQALATFDIDVRRDGLPAMTVRLEQKKAAMLRTKRGLMKTTAKKVHALGKHFLADGLAIGGAPRGRMPTGSGQVSPVGIGELLVVRQHTKAYVPGDVAHIENVLKTEKMSRETRRLERSETTFVTETETTKEEERDTQSTERFSLKRETSDTIKSDFEMKAGLAVDARYGPMVEVKATMDIASGTSEESSTKQSSEFGKDIVNRSVSKLTEKVREQRSITTISEFEEKVGHGFDNTAGNGHISGVYQWVDKLMEAQVYDYGKRLMFDVVVPEPASFYIYLTDREKAEGAKIEKPKEFTLSADDIDETTYLDSAREYGATGMEPPPALYKMLAKAWDGAPGPSADYMSKSETILIDDGYKALTAYVGRQRTTPAAEVAYFRMVLGSSTLDIESIAYHEVDMQERTGSVAVSFEGKKVFAYAVNLEILCQRTDRAMQVWQQKMHAAITQAYIARMADYERALAAAKATEGVTISGRNPSFNADFIASELKKTCISILTAQFYDAFGAVNLSVPEKYPQVNIAAADVQGSYLRFFEQAFEWERMMYFFYPYFWGLKKHWADRALLDDVDPLFGQYLRAGAARVVFPVRPGFEEAVIHYAETGELWSGGDPVDIHSSLYLPIVQEVKQSQGAPGNEVPVGEPWSFTLPTTLVKLRPDDKLPKWKKVGMLWQEED
ncbi:hypothetical protein QCE49_24100 [Caballeronia sp. LZ008]|uniref:hypothetical protein n=1 Tax=unclassified Caballeronia TaxID=2646786 RepID=UPI002029596C|nr:MULTISPECIES: hypothetical protein [unclassified Caballeronia]MDR5796472.1 hypothetical protein [Caballeronia sp. LZ008]